MAEFVNSIGQVRGKFGNVVAYVRANGKNYCKGASISRKPSTEPQKQQAAAFAVVVSRRGWMARAIRLGFPGNQYPKGFNGFTSANVTTAVTVEKVNPMKPIVRYKKAIQEYRVPKYRPSTTPQLLSEIAAFPSSAKHPLQTQPP